MKKDEKKVRKLTSEELKRVQGGHHAHGQPCTVIALCVEGYVWDEHTCRCRKA